MTAIDWNGIATAIADAAGVAPHMQARVGAGGGCINSAHRLTVGGRPFFVKVNRAEAVAMFEAEAEALAAMAGTGTVRVPQPVAWGLAGDGAYLALEYLDLKALDRATETALGRRLAAMHAATAPRFGWHRDNTIGSTPQCNQPDADWTVFWRERRLAPQLAYAAEAGHRGVAERGAALLERLDDLLAEHRPQASLLHGDLWGGNAAAAGGDPVLFDPATYYGDRETDLAMTELFGGFGRAFREAYEAAWPLEPGYATRRDLYNLYHVLNHLHLFGAGYRAEAERLIGRLLAA